MGFTETRILSYDIFEKPPRHLQKAVKLLENIIRQNSGLSEAQILLAKARWLANDTSQALKTLHDCLQNDPSLVEAHVLSAVINNEAGNVRAANSSLQQAFS